MFYCAVFLTVLRVLGDFAENWVRRNSVSLIIRKQETVFLQKKNRIEISVSDLKNDSVLRNKFKQKQLFSSDTATTFFPVQSRVLILTVILLEVNVQKNKIVTVVPFIKNTNSSLLTYLPTQITANLFTYLPNFLRTYLSTYLHS